MLLLLPRLMSLRPKHCTEFSITPGIPRVDCRTQTFISTIKRQLCDCLCWSQVPFVVCGRAVTWQNFFIFFLYGHHVINTPEYLTLHKQSGCFQQPLTLLQEDGCQGFPALCRDVSVAAFLLILYFLCEEHSISRCHVVNTLLKKFSVVFFI